MPRMPEALELMVTHQYRLTVLLILTVSILAVLLYEIVDLLEVLQEEMHTLQGLVRYNGPAILPWVIAEMTRNLTL